LQSAWATHLDPSKLQRVKGWIDISGNQFKPVDEVAFIAASGLEVGAVEIVMHGAEEEKEEQSVLLLRPVFAPEDSADSSVSTKEAGIKQKFELATERLNTASAPYVVSFHEAIENNWRLVTKPSHDFSTDEKAFISGSVPGLLNTRSQHAVRDVASASWVSEAATNQNMFEHRAIGPLLQEMAVTLLYNTHTAANKHTLVSSAARALVQTLSEPGKHLPADIKRQLSRDQAEIVDALLSWAASGSQSGSFQGKGWLEDTPARIPKAGPESMFMQYAKTKRWQTKLDLLTAAFLHLRLGKQLR